MTPATNTAINKATLLSAATERFTLSFCIVLYLLDVVDSLLLEDLRRLERVFLIAIVFVKR